MTAIPGTPQHRRLQLLHVAAATWLLLVSATVVIDHVVLSNLEEAAKDRTPAMRIAAVEGQMDDLAQQLEQHRQRPTALPQTRYESERRALDQRIAAVEEALGDHPTTDALQSLLARLDRMEARLATPRPTPSASVHPRAPAPVKPRPIEPAFRVIGVELRAGERFLAILPTTAGALAQVRLLRPGEAEAGWRLEAIERGAAVFRHGDETRRLSVPER
ncbi:hypothetical protein CJ010_10565 [Azoarcus sp. DD4]|uniref:hypothetical protein n=1 Tax=Azoarcus sp. DD4 TaxID=2027405 RepID=UPI0011299B42|nr:hypothetical protein [Azoarcus sp. DD4]QDF96939.1 hypothetical protein CJ010_10565 [Azoarcus sp. DD4]